MWLLGAWMLFSLNISDKFHFYLNRDSQDFIFIYLGVHEIDSEIERNPTQKQIENYSFRL